MDKNQLYKAALNADEAWSNELERLFGKHAGDVRYTKAGMGEPGSKLRLLIEAFRKANDAWIAAMKETQ
jgi:hypothetical protein